MNIIPGDEDEPIKREHEDPKQHFADKIEREQEHGSYILSEWERLNPNIPYGGNTFNYY